MQALRSSSLAESWSRGLGNSISDTHGVVVVLVKIVHLEFTATMICSVDYKFFI